MIQAIKKFSEGETPGAGRLNELVNAINLALRLIGESGIDTSVAGVTMVAFKIDSLAGSSAGFYKLRTFEGEFFARPERGNLTEAQLGPLSEGIDAIGVNLLQIVDPDAAVDPDSIYIGMIAGRVDNDSSYADLPIVAFAPGGALPKGQYQGMLLQMVTDNQLGYDYLVSHTMESI